MGRTHWFTIVALTCQLLLTLALLTSRLRAQEHPITRWRPQTQAAQAGGPAPEPSAQHAEEQGAAESLAAGSPQPGMATIRARTQEKVGHVYHLRGDTEIDYQQLVLRADEADYNDDTGVVEVRGHVTLDGGPYDEHLTASHGSYNVQTETGRFYDVEGTVAFERRGRRATLISTSPFSFSGKEVEKEGEERYIIHHGAITSCETPRPKWTFSAARIDVHVGDKAYIYNSAFDVKSVPIFYFPYTWHATEKLPRASGFLLPSFGTSSKKGFMLGDSFYWAINRSMDATLGAELWSSRGWAQHGEFRARPSDSSLVQANYFGVLDRGGKNHVDASGEDIYLTASGQLPWETRGVLAGEYLSSYAFRQTWAETFAQAINSEVNSVAFASKNSNGYSLNLIAQRYQNFESALQGDSIVISRLPALEASSVEQGLGDSRFFWSFDSSLAGLRRSEPDFHTDGLTGRFDFQPRLSYALESHGWTLRPELAPRETYYTEEHLPATGSASAGANSIGGIEDEAVNRRALEASVELRPPALHRIFAKPIFHRRWKHTIEPRAIYRYAQGVNNFAQFIRFDERDILSDTNEVEFGVINRLYAKPLATECSPNQAITASTAGQGDELNGNLGENLGDLESSQAEAAAPTQKECPPARPAEIVTWQLGQKVYFNRDFGGALAPGQRNVFTSTADFTGIAFLTDPRRISPVISRLRIFPQAVSDVGWDLDYDSKKGRISSSYSFADYRKDNWSFGGGHVYLVTPGALAAAPTAPIPSVFNQYRLQLGYGNSGKRGLSAAATVGFDVRQSFLQYSAVQSTYNWDCCGFTMEYRRIALGPLRNENQFRFAFTLANIGNFGNLKRTERIY